MQRSKLFNKFGFMNVGGCIHSINGDIMFDSCDSNYEISAWVYVDFKHKRVMIDCGRENEPVFLKGKFREQEQTEYEQHELEMDRKLAIAAGVAVENGKEV